MARAVTPVCCFYTRMDHETLHTVAPRCSRSEHAAIGSGISSFLMIHVRTPKKNEQQRRAAGGVLRDPANGSHPTSRVFSFNKKKNRPEIQTSLSLSLIPIPEFTNGVYISTTISVSTNPPKGERHSKLSSEDGPLWRPRRLCVDDGCATATAATETIFTARITATAVAACCAAHRLLPHCIDAVQLPGVGIVGENHQTAWPQHERRLRLALHPWSPDVGRCQSGGEVHDGIAPQAEGGGARSVERSVGVGHDSLAWLVLWRGVDGFDWPTNVKHIHTKAQVRWLQGVACSRGRGTAETGLKSAAVVTPLAHLFFISLEALLRASWKNQDM